MQVPGQERSNVRALNDPSQRGLVVEFQKTHQLNGRRNRRMVKSKNGPLGCRRRKLLSEPVQLGGRELAVVIARHRGVQGDQPHTLKIEYSVLRLSRRRAAPQDLRKRLALIVIAHHPDNSSS